jgi:signal recognition particle subunit SRP19
MRKQNKIILWSVYFDANKSRANGRRVSKKLSVSAPKLTEIHIAAEKVGLQPQSISDAAHPSTPWQKTGKLILPKTDLKRKLLEKIAKELSSMRS